MSELSNIKDQLSDAIEDGATEETIETLERQIDVIERPQSLSAIRVTLSGAFVFGKLKEISIDQEQVTVDVDGKPYCYALEEFAEDGALHYQPGGLA